MGVKTVFFSYFNGLIMLNGNPFNIPWMSESFIVIAQFWRKICTELLWKTNGCNLTHIGQNITVVTFLTHKTKLAVYFKKTTSEAYKDLITWVGWYTLLLEYQAVVLLYLSLDWETAKGITVVTILTLTHVTTMIHFIKKLKICSMCTFQIIMIGCFTVIVC